MTVTFSGLDSSGSILYTGSVTNVSVLAGQNTDLGTIALYAVVHSISGTITSGGVGVPGVFLTLTEEGSTVPVTGQTDSTGYYTISGLFAGNYTVVASSPAYILSPSSLSVTVSTANVTGQDFTATPLTYSLQGTVTNGSGTGIGGVTVTVNSGSHVSSALSDTTGHYIITGLPNSTYSVSAFLTGYAFTPASGGILIYNANSPDYNFIGSNTGSITGTLIWESTGTISFGW